MSSLNNIRGYSITSNINTKLHCKGKNDAPFFFKECDRFHILLKLKCLACLRRSEGTVSIIASEYFI